MRKIREKIGFFMENWNLMDSGGVMTKQNSTLFGEIRSVPLFDRLEAQGFQIFLVAHLRDVASLFEFINYLENSFIFKAFLLKSQKFIKKKHYFLIKFNIFKQILSLFP